MTMTFDGPTTTPEPAITAELTLTPIGEGEWLIHDERYQRQDPRCLVAFVREEAGADAEVVWLGRVSPQGPFRTARAACDAARGAIG